MGKELQESTEKNNKKSIIIYKLKNGKVEEYEKVTDEMLKNVVKEAAVLIGLTNSFFQATTVLSLGHFVFVVDLS